MKFPRNAKIFRGQLDVAPFASVFFLLAVFMVFSSLLVSSPGVKIQLPELSGSDFARVSLPKLDVAVDASGRIYFESQRVTHQELRNRLEKAAVRFTNNKPTLVLQADEDADLGTVLQICQIAVDIGIKQTVWTGRAKPFDSETEPPKE
ncbi:biopolymer transporter ExbD [bacterium]|jgi:biopolymer transport protein TolR|nr:biopolymer transporter ExbD [bacterium]MDA7645600.1 biopolymer transporter ExbD [bacterium]